jgi:pimeloyl-ACP methyl ester carboxylesterase
MNEINETNRRSPVLKAVIKWVSRIILIALITPLVLLLLGFIYETVASRWDETRYPPPGEMIDIGGYQLHMHCTGEREPGQPIVVIEAGSGSSSIDWVLVQPEITKYARVCSYDRAGLGWSDPGPAPRSSQGYADELSILLEKSGEKPPYLFVAHSLGAHTVRIYTDEYPKDVVGMVLVDARHPTMDYPSRTMGSGQLMLWEFLARCGFFRLIGQQMVKSEAPSMAEAIPDYPVPIAFDADYFKTTRIQDLTIPESDQRTAETGPFGDLPLVVIARDYLYVIPFLSSEETKAAEEQWRAAQEDMVNLSTNNQFFVAEGSGHNVPIDNPEIIVAVVKEMLENQ